MATLWIATGAACCAVAVIAGAFGAHGLADRLEPRQLELWETAARYFIYGGFGQILMGLAAHVSPRRGLDLAAILLLVGSLVFSATVAILALGGPRWLGAITPLGGLAMIAGFVVFAIVALRM